MTAAGVTACLGCQGRCCTAYIVPLTGHDIWRIVQAQRLAPELFVQREPEDYPSDWGFLLRPSGSTYALALQHQPARHSLRPCVFLLQLRDGIQRCGIYAHRPLACQTYPMQLQADYVDPRGDMLCPRGSWSGLASEQAHWRERLVQQDQEWRLYARVVQSWNAAVRAQPADRGYVLEQYLEYLVNAYDYIDAVWQPRGDEPLAAQVERELAALAANTCQQRARYGDAGVASR